MDTTEHDSDVQLAYATLVWDQLAERVDALLSAWDRGEAPPQLAEFLPAEIGPARRMILIELIKVDLEQRHQRGQQPKLLESYATELPELATGGQLPADLIYEEYHVRKQAGEAVEPGEYFRRFPNQIVELGRLLGLEAPNATTTLVPASARIEPPQVGETVDDFDLLTQLGKGAFAHVFLARQRSMQRLVALKISADRGNEPQTMAQLDHPHIVRVFDQRQLPDRQLRLLYMQYVSGGTLEGVIRHVAKLPPSSRNGAALLAAVDSALMRQGESAPLGAGVRQKLERASWPEAVCWLGSRIASALAYAHGAGVLHRDVKPANVLVAADGSPKLADFNISFSSALTGVTPAAYFGGSLAYMSPEQLEICDPASGREPEYLDGRSDVYALGVMLWELLTLRRPFADETPDGQWTQTLRKMIEQRKQGVPKEARGTLPANCLGGMVDVLLHCMAFDRDDRISSASEAARQLDLCLQPRAQRLLVGDRQRWDYLPRKYPLLISIATVLVPNVLMSLLNTAYNIVEVVPTLSEADKAIFFNYQIAWINLVAYSVGISIGYSYFRPVVLAVGQVWNKERIPPDRMAWLRGRCLTLGSFAALMTACLWAISGIVFPFWMQAEAGSESSVTMHHYMHFFTSQFVCGTIGATISFFCATFLSIRCFLPVLLKVQPADPHEVGDLADLARRVWIGFGLAGVVPFATIPVMVLVDTGKGSVAVLSLAGLIGSGLCYLLALLIRGDLDALAATISPSGRSLSETSDSFWTGSK